MTRQAEIRERLDGNAYFGPLACTDIRWLLACVQELEEAHQAIVDLPIDEDASAAWHFAEVRRIARAVLVSAGTRDEASS